MIYMLVIFIFFSGALKMQADDSQLYIVSHLFYYFNRAIWVCQFVESRLNVGLGDAFLNFVSEANNLGLYLDTNFVLISGNFLLLNLFILLNIRFL